MRTETIYRADKTGTVNDRLEQLLFDMGFHVISISYARGFWAMQDVHRWEASCKDRETGRSVQVVSWHSATECVTKPVMVRANYEGFAGMFEVSPDFVKKETPTGGDTPGKV